MNTDDSKKNSPQENSSIEAAEVVRPRTKVLWMAVLAALVLGTGGVTLAAAGAYLKFSTGLPDIITLADYQPRGVTRVLGGATAEKEGSESELLAEFYKERRYVIPFEKIPGRVVDAFVAAEDDSFFEHEGINFLAIARAAIANFKAGHVVQGGSTITQQVAKSLLLTPEKSFGRKFREMILASRMESNLSKQEILFLYLNQIYLGSGAYGVQAAAKAYFNKDISDVTIAEAAILAGMPQAPGRYSPLLNPKQAKRRQQYVLRRMLDTGKISKADWDSATAEKVRVYPGEDFKATDAAFYIEHVRRYLVEKYGDKAVYEDGMTVSVPTTRQLSKTAAEQVQAGLRAVDKRIGWAGPLKRLQSDDEITTFLKETRKGLLKKAVPYLVLTTEGELSSEEAVKQEGLTRDIKLLRSGELYEAVVTSVDSVSKSVGVLIGSIKAELPAAEFKWARPIKDERTVVQAKGDPSNPAALFLKGDVLLVRLISVEGAEPVRVTLEQRPLVQSALASIESTTGRVLALQGGYDFTGSEFNRAVQAQRQPGSSFKPLIYAAAVERGFTSATVIVDSPIVFKSEENGNWKPANFEEKFYGDTTFRMALVKSRNVPTIKLVQAMGVGEMIQFTKRIGMENTKLNPDLSISLGSGGASVLDMTKAYSLFPRLGRRVDPVFIHRVRDRNGLLLEEVKGSPGLDLDGWNSKGMAQVNAASSDSPAPYILEDAPARPSVQRSVLGLLGVHKVPSSTDPAQVMDPRVAYVMTNIMKDVVNFGTGYEAKSLGRISAGKTGTTNDYLDAWYIGYTPEVITGVWVGYDSQKPIGPGETGARAALPIWLGFMKEAVKNSTLSDFPVPTGITFSSVNPDTGQPVGANTAKGVQMAFIQGTEPGAAGVSIGVGAAASQTADTGDDTSDIQPAAEVGTSLKEDIQ
jgi:penicillin-binding protein 1A